MRYYQIALFYFLSTNFSFAQDKSAQFEISCPVSYINSKPEFPGGIDKLNSFFKSKLNSKKFQNNSFSVEFAIGKDGKVGSIEFLDKSLKISKKQINKIVEEMPNWKPGIFESRVTESKIVLTVNI